MGQILSPMGSVFTFKNEIYTKSMKHMFPQRTLHNYPKVNLKFHTQTLSTFFKQLEPSLRRESFSFNFTFTVLDSNGKFASVTP